ncbi:hypothetical protein GCM10010363_73570 [Streptomyces omiyaensis]|nr:hypothetical protein GCM10010363_73570 [Streptomyces omiyaensis]
MRDPHPSMATSCTSRSIYLAAGDYSWKTYNSLSLYDPASRNIYLAAGTYTWQDCLVPQNLDYRHTSTLSYWGGSASIATDDYLAATNQATWGSVLTPLF